ncbi:hypothetical protein Gpo141_00013377 [Globisporangium polare]
MAKSKSVQVGKKSPDSSSDPETINGAVSPGVVASLNDQPSPPPAKITRIQVVGALYNWTAWIFIMVMVFSQFLGIVWNTVETNLHDVQGHLPAAGASALQGTGDEPYADRVFACVEAGRYYKPVQLSDLVGSGAVQVDDTTGSSVNGYRIVERKGLALQPSMLDSYTDVCALIATTMDAIFDSCASLGYNVTQDSLRVLNGINSKTTLLIPNSLPMVAMPFADNSLDMRFAIPGYDGNACMFRLLGKYLDKTKTVSVFRGVDRSIRASKTAEWLGQPGGVWKNGWYEDPSGAKWYSDVMSSDQKSVYGVPQRQFDTLKHKELDCINTLDCKDPAVVEAWGAKFTTTIQTLVASSITISNGERFGLYFNEVYQHRAIQSIYDWETLISNTSLGFLLGRWMFAMYALQNGYFQGESRWYNAGIGCLASSRSFNMLPIVLLPRLKITLSAFWSVGCEFDGAQKALSEAWFVVYPAILELMLLQFSLLNIFAKIARRRIPDSPFGPSVVFFCILHWLRMDIAKPGSFFGINGRVTPILTSDQFEDLRLLDYFISKAPLRLNGNIHSLIAIKLVVIGLNFIPLLLTKSTDALLNGPNGEVIKPIGIEKALAIRACKVGGLGRSLVYDRATVSVASAKKTDAINEWSGINSYELVRLGYLVYGDKFLISFDDWESLTLVAPFQRFYYLWNNRVTLFTLRDAGDGAKAASEKPHMSRLDDPRLQGLRWWKVVGRPVR